jgi:hypothetical protein
MRSERIPVIVNLNTDQLAVDPYTTATLVNAASPPIDDAIGLSSNQTLVRVMGGLRQNLGNFAIESCFSRSHVGVPFRHRKSNSPTSQ